MSPFRRGGAGKRRDANEKAICDALETVGARVWRVSGLGLPDVIVWHRGRPYVAEIKTATGKLKPSQADIPWPIWRTPEEALHAIGAAK